VEVYQRAGNIVRRGTAKGKAHTGETVVFDRITHHNPNSLRTVLAKAIVFEGWNEKKKKFVLRHPPKDYAGCLLDHPDKNYPILHGLISAPTLRADGSILDVSGYDERSGLYFDPKGADFGTIPINPTRGDALAALKELDEPIAKFPFVDEASKSVQLARMLTGIVRTALMTSPMFAYTAPTPRTGKSLLVDIACILSHGHVAPVIVASSTFEERDKQLQAALAGGDTIVALDNQNSDEDLTSDALSQMLTQPIVKVRPFGQNKELLEYPSMSVISVTGNNLAVAKDLTERTVLCQVDAKMEVPGSRKFTFNPIVMARQNRVRLVRACLIILRAYVVAGRPPQDFNPMGGFEDWSEWVRSAIVWLGRADPCATMSVVRSMDQGRGVHVTIMELWEQAIGFDVEISATEVAKCAKQREESGRPDFNSALWMTVGKHGKNLPMALGRWLASKCGVVIGGRRFVAGGRSGHPTYRLRGKAA
jgi:putative DNA primase/helicase